MGGDSTAPTKVTSVSLTDSDTTENSGIDGRDLTIVWTPATTPDSSFDRYKLYVLPAATALDVDLHSPVDVIYGGQYEYDSSGVQLTTYTYTGGSFIMKDSAGGAFSAGNYNAYIIAVDFAGNSSATAMSSVGTLGDEAYDAGSDSHKPFIMHMGVGQAEQGKDIVLIARFEDDRQLGAVPGVGAQVVYKVPAGEWTTVNCVLALANTNYYTCTIPNTAAVNDTTVNYYLKSADTASTPNIGYISASAANDMTESVTEETIKTAPFQINITASAGYQDDEDAVDLSGNVYKSDGSVFANDQQPRLFIEGTGFGLATPANTTGLFEFADETLPNGSYNLVAFKNGYMDINMSVFKNDSINIYLNEGEMIMDTSGGDAYMEMPFVTWTAPGDGMMGAPNDIYCASDCSTIGAGEMPIIIGFSKEMNANTINDLDAANAGSNIFLTPDGGNTRIAGKVKYVYNASTGINEARFYSSSHSTLTPGTFYSIVVTQNVTDINGAAIPGGAMADGSFSNSFTTMMDMDTYIGTAGYTDISDGYATGGMMMPPYVKGTTPQPGAFNVDRNVSVVVEFSEPMDSTSISANSVKLYPISNETNWAVGDVVLATVSLDQATQKIVTLNPTTNLGLNTANSGWYVLRIMGSVKSAKGVWLGNPMNCGTTSPDTCLLTETSYESDFQLNSTEDGDTTAPTILGTYPSNGATGVEVGIGGVEIGFSEPMLPSTMMAQNITLKAGSSSVTGKVNYDPIANTAKFIPASALLANTQYTLAINTSVTDLAGVPLAAINSIIFASGSADVTLPELVYASSDDYAVAITFSEPMNSAKQTDVNRWATSVLNPANYFVTTLNGSGTEIAPYSSATVLTGISGLSFAFDEVTNTVMIEGFGFTASESHPVDLQIFIDNVKDKSNNAIANTDGRVISGGNATQCPIQNSTDTYGMLGPGGGGMMMMGPMGGGPTAGPGMDMGMMGMMGGGVMPMNMMAGQTSMYFVDIPVTKSIPAGGKIVLTFPSGFNVANAAKDANSPLNDDINEWGQGTVAIDTVVGVQSSRTITITTKTAATMSNDFLHMDIAGIVNSSIPKGFGTDGYTVDIKTMTSVGVVLENITTMPFYIQEAGARTISGSILGVASGDDGTMSVFLGSPMTGPMEQDVTITGDTGEAAGTFSFTSLPDGEYYLFTEPSNIINGVNYLGNPMPESIWLSGSNATGKDITLATEATGATQIYVVVKGDFSTSSTADQIDIFAGSPSGFRVKTVTPITDDGVGETDVDGVDNNTGGNTDTSVKYSFYLPNGRWNVGIGPAMPKGAMSGPPPMPDWMPPMSVDVDVNGATVIDGSGTSNDSIITFDISTQSTYQILGQVINDSGTGIANAEVWAFSPMGGMGGAHTKTEANGNFTLKVGVLGFYQVGAHKPGIPGGREQTVEVRTGGTVWLSGSQISLNTDFQIVLKQPSYTISGKVLNSSSQAVAYAPVWAWQQSGWGHADTMTDSSGNYILYVDNGTWFIETDAPGVGWLQYDLPIVVNGASQSSINLKPATDVTFYDISGNIEIDGSNQLYMPLRASLLDCTTGVYLGRDYGGVTDSGGDYTISVPGPGTGVSQVCYRVDSWTPDYGEIEANNLDGDNNPNEGYSQDDMVEDNPANVLITNADVSGVDILITDTELSTITLVFANANTTTAQEGFVKIKEVSFGSTPDYNNAPIPTGFYKSLRITNLNAGDSVELRGGYYQFFVDVPGLGFYIPDSYATNPTDGRDENYNCIIVIDNTSRNVDFTLPDITDITEVITFTANVTDGSTGLSDAWFWVSNPNTGFNTGCSTTSGACTVTVPLLAVGDYKIGADKPGYMSAEPTSRAGNADVTVDITLTIQGNVISGYICDDADSDYVCATSERIPNGWIRGEDIDTGKMSYAPVDGNGFFELGVSNGNWKVYGSANGYSETQYSESGADVILNVNNNDWTSIHLPLAADSNYVVKTKSKTMKPSSGGTVDDTGSGGTGVKVTIPPQALGSSTSNGSVSVTETSAVSATNSAEPFAGKGKEVTALDNSNQPINNLSDYIDVEMNITKTEIDAEVASGALVDMSTLEPLQMSYWDDTVQNWTSLPTDKDAYYKETADSTEWTLYQGDEDDKTDMEEFIEDALVDGTIFAEGTDFVDYKLVLTASTNHLTVFGATGPKDGLSPAAPAGLAQTSGSGISVGLSWTWDATNTDTTACVDFAGYEVYRCAVSGTCSVIGDYTQLNSANIAQSTLTFTDNSTNSTSTPTAFTSYYYKVSAGDTTGNETYSSAVQVCSTNAVENGSVATNCTITCNTGYSQSGNSCVVSGGTIVPGGGGPSAAPATPTTTPEMPVSTTGEITATADAGGKTTITTIENVEASVRLPANAVSASTEVAIAPVSVAETTVETVVSAVAAVSVGSSIVGGQVYNITAESSGVAVTEFSKYVTITLSYKTAQIEGFKESSLAINYWDETATEWVALDTTVDKATNTLTAQTLHFTYFAVMGEEGEDEPEEGEPIPVSEMTTAQIKARIAEITALIVQLQAQLNQLFGVSGVEGCTITSFDRTLKQGISGDDVKCLQIILNFTPNARVAGTGVGSSGNETNYFGSLTKAAVVKFQEKYADEILSSWGLTSGTGLVGSATRDKLNSLLK